MSLGIDDAVSLHNNDDKFCQQSASLLQQDEIGMVEEFGTAPTSPVNPEEGCSTKCVITQQPLPNRNSQHSYCQAENSGNLSSLNDRREKKIIHHPERDKNKWFLCCVAAEDIHPGQIDMCPEAWYRNCCTWQDLLEDAKLPKLRRPFSSEAKHHNGVVPSQEMEDPSANEDVPPKISKRVIAERICWRACFVTFCLPIGYTCYMSRTMRRRRRHGDVSRREALLQPTNSSSKNDDLTEPSRTNKTLLIQVGEVKHMYKSKESENKNGAKMRNNSDSAAFQQAQLETELINRLEQNDVQKLGPKPNEDVPTECGDNKMGKTDNINANLNVINVNVIVLESGSSQILHHHLSKQTFYSKNNR